MGTRNLTMVQLNGAYKVAQYGQWDGYPSGNGLVILKFLRKCNIDVFCKKVKHARLISDEEYAKYWQEIGIDINKEQFVDIEKSEEFKALHPSLNRDMGADILEYIYNQPEKRVDLIGAINFAKNSLFCEWGYVVDLDKNTFEVYKGFNKTPLHKGDRFHFNGAAADGYYPIKLLKSYDLDNLPDDETFLKDTETNDSE